MKTKYSIRLVRTALFVLFFLTLSPTVFTADAPPLGVTEEIEITSNLPRRGRAYVYEFEQPIEQGDRLKVFVSPVGGAKLKSSIRVGLPNAKDSRYKAFATAKPANTHDWTMPEGAPGDRVWVQIVVFGTGKLNIRLNKVGSSD